MKMTEYEKTKEMVTQPEVQDMVPTTNRAQAQNKEVCEKLLEQLEGKISKKMIGYVFSAMACVASNSFHAGAASAIETDHPEVPGRITSWNYPDGSLLEKRLIELTWRVSSYGSR
jgi:hypothetical protein